MRLHKNSEGYTIVQRDEEHFWFSTVGDELAFIGERSTESFYDLCPEDVADWIDRNTDYEVM